MYRSLRGRLLAAATVFCIAPMVPMVPAAAQVSVSVSFDDFHSRLSRYGNWVYSDRWGTVWQPADVRDDFRPYDTGGHWEYTSDYGWMWVSDYDWGDVTFHYGRWVNDPDDGWLWMPGYVWSPAWVVWRGNNDYLGWMPMPPDDNFISGRGDIGVSVSWNDPDRYYNDWYGPSYRGGSSLWVFVNYGHIADRDYHRYAVPRDQAVTLVRQTQNITNYTVVNNYVVNRSIDVRRVEQVSHQQIRPVQARTLMKNPGLISTVAHGDQVRAQMINMAPRGTGKPNSAPRPSSAVINQLSDHAVARGAGRGGEPKHLFTKSALSQPDAAKHFSGGASNPAPLMQGAPGNNAGPAQKGNMNDERKNRMDRMNGANPVGAGKLNGGPGMQGNQNGPDNGASEQDRQRRMERMNGAKPSGLQNTGPKIGGSETPVPKNDNGAALNRGLPKKPVGDNAPVGRGNFGATGPDMMQTGAPAGGPNNGASVMHRTMTGPAPGAAGPTGRSDVKVHGENRGPDNMPTGASGAGPDTGAPMTHRTMTGPAPGAAGHGDDKARGDSSGDHSGPDDHNGKPKKENQGGPPQ